MCAIGHCLLGVIVSKYFMIRANSSLVKMWGEKSASSRDEMVGGGKACDGGVSAKGGGVRLPGNYGIFKGGKKPIGKRFR